VRLGYLVQLSIAHFLSKQVLLPHLHATWDAKEAHDVFVKIVTQGSPLTESDTLGHSSSATVDVGTTFAGDITDVLRSIQGKEGIRRPTLEVILFTTNGEIFGIHNNFFLFILYTQYTLFLG
jgi:hypothetical protein